MCNVYIHNIFALLNTSDEHNRRKDHPPHMPVRMRPCTQTQGHSFNQDNTHTHTHKHTHTHSVFLTGLCVCVRVLMLEHLLLQIENIHTLKHMGALVGKKLQKSCPKYFFCILTTSKSSMTYCCHILPTFFCKHDQSCRCCYYDVDALLQLQ